MQGRAGGMQTAPRHRTGGASGRRTARAKAKAAAAVACAVPASPRLLVALAALVPWLCAGCHYLEQPRGTTPLKPVQMSQDSVVLDLFFVRVPFGEDEVNGRLWDEVDEQQFPSELRQRLGKNGFRVGLVGSRVPMTVSKLLELKDKPAPSTSGGPETKLLDMENDPRVVRRHLQLRAEHRGEIATSGIYERVPILICDREGICGQEYIQAQGFLAMLAHLERDGRVRLDLTPELQHGESRPQFIGFTGSQAGFRLEQSRPRRSFDDLAMHPILAPGDMLVMTSVSCRPGSLGHHFFTQVNGGKREQKVLLIRLSQTQHDELFNPSQPLSLDVLPK